MEINYNMIYSNKDSRSVGFGLAKLKRAKLCKINSITNQYSTNRKYLTAWYLTQIHSVNSQLISVNSKRQQRNKILKLFNIRMDELLAVKNDSVDQEKFEYSVKVKAIVDNMTI